MADIENQGYQYNNNQAAYNQNGYGDDYDANQGLVDKQNEGLLGHSRLGFIRKVYLILAAQLVLTVLMTVAAMYSEGFSDFQQNNLWLMYVSIAVMFIVEIAIVCFRSVARTVPTNYICLTIFTLCMSYLVSAVCSVVKQQSEDGQKTVFIAAIMTLGIVVALTIYAFKTKTDFTMMGGFLFCFAMILIIFSIILAFQYSKTAYVVYCALGCLLYSLYLIYDTQLIAGGKRYALSIDDYVLGALMLYIDIIGLFLEILRLLSSR